MKQRQAWKGNEVSGKQFLLSTSWYIVIDRRTPVLNLQLKKAMKLIHQMKLKQLFSSQLKLPTFFTNPNFYCLWKTLLIIQFVKYL